MEHYKSGDEELVSNIIKTCELQFAHDWYKPKNISPETKFKYNIYRK